MRPETLEQRVANHQELRAVLDGEANQAQGGWDCICRDKALFVPDHCCAGDPTHAILLCKQGGLITAKLNAMEPERAWIVYRLTLPRPEPIN